MFTHVAAVLAAERFHRLAPTTVGAGREGVDGLRVDRDDWQIKGLLPGIAFWVFPLRLVEVSERAAVRKDEPFRYQPHLFFHGRAVFPENPTVRNQLFRRSFIAVRADDVISLVELQQQAEPPTALCAESFVRVLVARYDW